MSTPILTTKLYIPPSRSKVVPRPHLTRRLNEGLLRRLTLISASAGFGKTTLVSEWVNCCERPAAWLSLDEEHNDPACFLAYLIAALQTVHANIGEGVLSVLQSSQPPPTESILTALINEITILPDKFILVLDDYHLIDTKAVDNALTFLLEHLPPQMHMVISTREDPHLPLARLRVRGQLTELHTVDLRFTLHEAADFLGQVMDLDLPAEEIAQLATRTEGWIAGLQLAAISLQGQKETTSFIKSFTGSHRFVLDYLIEEVLEQQPESVQNFLLRTSILDRLCGPLCDTVLPDSSVSGQETLEYLEHANLFIVPLDNERHWYRYHHLFADLLRQRLRQSSASSTGDEKRSTAELHIRASVWYEENRLEIEAFQHAAAANDVERAERLIEGEGMPLQFRGATAPVLNWLESLPATVLDTRPSLCVTYASALMFAGQPTGIEQKLRTAEAALQGIVTDNQTRDLVGHIAAIRAMLAISQYQVETMIAQSHRALSFLHPDNLPVRSAANWTLGLACQLQGDRAAASQAFTEVMSISQASGNIIFTIAAATGLGQIQESENQLYLAARNYRHVLQLVGDPPWPTACEAFLGLARICYEWNDLDTAREYVEQSVHLARQLESIDTPVACELVLARLELARGDVTGAVVILDQANHFVRQHNFLHRIPEIADVQVLTLLHQGNLTAAAHLAEKHELPISKARVHLARGETSAALALLIPLHEQVEKKDLKDELLRIIVLQALASHAHGEKEKAAELMGDALALAEPGGFVRIFVDEGIPMARLLSEASDYGIMPDYIARLLAVFDAEEQKSDDKSNLPPASPAQPLIEPLSRRELEVLGLIAHGLSNHEISERLFLALSTVKGHNLKIFGKLDVQRRTEAVARARELGLL